MPSTPLGAGSSDRGLRLDHVRLSARGDRERGGANAPQTSTSAAIWQPPDAARRDAVRAFETHDQVDEGFIEVHARHVSYQLFEPCQMNDPHPRLVHLRLRRPIEMPSIEPTSWWPKPTS
jgi:hypothetical protein